MLSSKNDVESRLSNPAMDVEWMFHTKDMNTMKYTYILTGISQAGIFV